MGIDLRIVFLQAGNQIDSGVAPGLVDRDRTNTCRSQRRGDGRADAAGANQQHLGAFALEAVTLDAANETGTVEHVAEQRSVRTLEDGVAGASDLGRCRNLIDQADRGHLVRHGNQCTMHIAHPEDRLQRVGIILSLDAHRDDHGIDTVFVKPGVVDQRRFESLGREADVGNQCGFSA